MHIRCVYKYIYRSCMISVTYTTIFSLEFLRFFVLCYLFIWINWWLKRQQNKTIHITCIVLGDDIAGARIIIGTVIRIEEITCRKYNIEWYPFGHVFLSTCFRYPTQTNWQNPLWTYLFDSKISSIHQIQHLFFPALPTHVFRLDLFLYHHRIYCMCIHFIDTCQYTEI